MQRGDEVNCSAVGQLESLDLVIVCFGSAIPLEETLIFLQCKAFAENNVNIFVVNNSQHDSDEIRRLCNQHDATFLQMVSNIGFGAAVNHGVSAGDGSYILVLSPGSLVSASTVNLLRQTANRRSDLVGLGLMNETVSGRISYKVRSVVDFGLKRGIFARIIAKNADIIPTSFISGGGFMVQRSVFEKVGGFDEEIFLFHEDDDFSARLSSVGSLGYVRSATCVHKRNSQARTDPELRRVRGWHLGHSKLYVLKKHHGHFGVAIAIVSSLAYLASPIYLFSKNRRIKVNAFIAGTIAGLKGVPASKGVLPRPTSVSVQMQPRP